MRSQSKRKDLDGDALDLDSLLFVPPSRSDTISRLKQQRFDLLVIGGGSTGTGCALDAASRGISCACIEAGDFASGTSSKSTKLVHGGVRYLEKAFRELDVAQYRLVKEALQERQIVLRIAPHLTDVLPIMLPLYNMFSAPYYWLGTKAYDFIAGSYKLLPSYGISRERAIREFPLLKKEGLIGALVYYDGQQDDARMNVGLALTAMRYGSAVCNYIRVIGLIKDGPDGRVIGATVKDEISGDQFDIRAAGVVNATGPFCDSIRQMDDPNAPKIVSASAGVHIVLPEYYSPRSMGLIDPSTKDKRVIFFLPWQFNSLAGTTDVSVDSVSINNEPEAKHQDIDYIIEELNKYLGSSDHIRLRKCDVQSCWAGLRPLVANVNIDATTKHSSATASIVRNHLIATSPSGLITVTGGKWTTYRLMAEDTISRAIEQFGLIPKNGPQCRTSRLKLIGAHGYTDLSYVKLVQQFGYETEVARHLSRSYGDRCIGVAMLEDADDPGKNVRWPLSGKRLVPWYPYIEAEVRWAVRNELAMKPMDVLCRRTRLAFHNCRAALDALPKICDIMGAELKWSAEIRKEREEEAKTALVKMGLTTVNENKSESNREQLRAAKKVFERLSAHNGYLVRDGSLNEGDKALVSLLQDKSVISLIDYLEALH